MSFILDKLMRLRGAPKVRKFATIDIETEDWVNPYAVGFYDGKTYHDWVTHDGPRCITLALRHVLQKEYTGYWIYAHNGGNYDFLFFLREWVKQEWDKYRIEITPIQSSIIMIKVMELDPNPVEPGDVKPGMTWTFVDSVRLFPIKLNDVGTTFGIGKKVELKMSYKELAQPKNEALMRKYLKQDCVLLHKGLTEMQRRVNALGGQLGVTLPSTALDIFRRRYLKTDIYTNRHYADCEWMRDEENRRRKTAKEPHHEREPHPSGNRGSHTEREPDLHDADVLGALHSRGGADIRGPGIGRDHSRMRGGDSGNDRARGPHRPKRYTGVARPPKCYGCHHEFIRRGYFGGRSEIFRMAFEPCPGHPHALMYDINSHYPHCMLARMPVGVATVVDGMSPDEVFRNLKRQIGIVECEVEIPDDCYLPPLPLRMDGKLKFPSGRFTGVWDTEELRLLPRIGGRIIRTMKSSWFEARPVFATYIKELYKMRDKSRSDYNAGLAWIAKILMNATYGKFAMKEERTKVWLHPESPVGLTCIDLDSDLWYEKVHMSPNYVVPQLSVHVTALARARLWELLQSVHEQGGRVYYCDTDSIVCSGEGVELPTSTELGGLKLEATITRAEFVLPKLYLIETTEDQKGKRKEANIKVRSKGMGPGIRTDALGDDPLDGQLSEEEFHQLVRHGMTINRERMAKFKESLNQYAKEMMEFPRLTPSSKQIRSQYDKRLVLDNLDTAPIILSQAA